MRSLKPFTHFLMVMDAWGACSSRYCCAPMVYYKNHCFTSASTSSSIERSITNCCRVRTDGDWESWLLFFLTGVYETANQAVQTSRKVLELFQHDQQRIEKQGRSLGTTLRIFKLLQSMPLVTISKVSRETTLSIPTVSAALARLEGSGIVREITSRRRDKLYSYEQYIYLLNEGTEPIGW
jgi:Fic family protein